MQANHKFVQILVSEAKKTGFQAVGSNLLEGKVISVGDKVEQIKKGDTVTFDTNKSLVHAIDGKNYYFTNYETILCLK